MLIWRLLISAIVIPLLVLILYVDSLLGPSAPILMLVALSLAIRGSLEMVLLLKTRSFAPSRKTVIGCTVAVVASTWYGRLGIAPISIGPAGNSLGPVLLAFTLCILILFLNGALRYKEPGRSMETVSVELLIVSYVGLLLSMVAQLRWVAGAEAGYLVLGSLVVVTKFGDVGAFFTGRTFGGRKMTPLLSPGKTWSGAGGALAGSAVGSYLWLTYGTPLFNAAWQPPTWYWTIVYGVLLGLTGIIGDLCESLVKRDVGQKDSAKLLPGFGGILDLLDSVIYAGPVAYLLWKALPLATWTDASTF